MHFSAKNIMNCSQKIRLYIYFMFLVKSSQFQVKATISRMNEGLKVSAVARPGHCVLSFVWDQLVTNVWHDILTSHWSSFYIPASDWLMSDMSPWDKVWSTFSHEDRPCVPVTVTDVHLIRCQQEKTHLWSDCAQCFIKVGILVPLISPPGIRWWKSICSFSAEYCQ